MSNNETLVDKLFDLIELEVQQDVLNKTLYPGDSPRIKEVIDNFKKRPQHNVIQKLANHETVYPVHNTHTLLSEPLTKLKTMWQGTHHTKWYGIGETTRRASNMADFIHPNNLALLEGLGHSIVKAFGGTAPAGFKRINVDNEAFEQNSPIKNAVGYNDWHGNVVLHPQIAVELGGMFNPHKNHLNVPQLDEEGPYSWKKIGLFSPEETLEQIKNLSNKIHLNVFQVLMHELFHSASHFNGGYSSKQEQALEEATTEILSQHHARHAFDHFSGGASKLLFIPDGMNGAAPMIATSYPTYCRTFANLVACTEGLHNVNDLAVLNNAILHYAQKIKNKSRYERDLFFTEKIMENHFPHLTPQHPAYFPVKNQIHKGLWDNDLATGSRGIYGLFNKKNSVGNYVDFTASFAIDILERAHSTYWGLTSAADREKEAKQFSYPGALTKSENENIGEKYPLPKLKEHVDIGKHTWSSTNSLGNKHWHELHPNVQSTLLLQDFIHPGNQAIIKSLGKGVVDMIGAHEPIGFNSINIEKRPDQIGQVPDDINRCFHKRGDSFIDSKHATDISGLFHSDHPFNKNGQTSLKLLMHELLHGASSKGSDYKEFFKQHIYEKKDPVNRVEGQFQYTNPMSPIKDFSSKLLEEATTEILAHHYTHELVNSMHGHVPKDIFMPDAIWGAKVGIPGGTNSYINYIDRFGRLVALSEKLHPASEKEFKNNPYKMIDSIKTLNKAVKHYAWQIKRLPYGARTQYLIDKIITNHFPHTPKDSDGYRFLNNKLHEKLFGNETLEFPARHGMLVHDTWPTPERDSRWILNTKNFQRIVDQLKHDLDIVTGKIQIG